MARWLRRTHDPAFKAKAALAAIKVDKTLVKLAQDFDVRPSQIKQWRDQLFEGATGVFGVVARAEPEPTIDMKTLHAKIEPPLWMHATPITWMRQSYAPGIG